MELSIRERSRWQRPRGRLLLLLTVLLLTAGGVTTGAAPALAAQPPASASSSEDAEAPQESQVFEQGFSAPQTSKNSQASRAGVCEFVQRVDRAHISSSVGARAVQSHGNWGNVNCSYSQANVTTQVDKRNAVGFYVAVGTQGKGILAPSTGLGSGGPGRVTARYVCNGTGTNSFRSWTDVDVIGIDDLPNKQYSPGTDIACG